MAINRDDPPATGEHQSPDENSGVGIDPASIFGATGDIGGNNGDGNFDPAIHVSRDKRNTDGSYTKRRGRRKGDGSGGSTHRAKAPRSDRVDALARVLLYVHAGIAGITNTPELQLEQQESELLAKPLVNLMGDFNITIDPRVENAIALITASAMVYGPRVINIRQRKSEEKGSKSPANPIHTETQPAEHSMSAGPAGLMPSEPMTVN